MIGVESFRNPKNQSQEQSEGKQQKEKTKVRTKIKSVSRKSSIRQYCDILKSVLFRCCCL